MRKAIRIIIFIVLLAGVVYASSLVYIISVAYHPNVPAHADAALVLGAKVNLDNSPSEALYNRTLAAADLYSQGKVDYILVTGGVGLGAKAESQIAAVVATQHGVPADRIISENESHNTFDNVGDVQAQAHAKNIKSVVVTSDRFHVARGILVAKHFGFNPVYWDFPSQGYYRKSEIIRNYLREALAIIVYMPRILSLTN